MGRCQMQSEDEKASPHDFMSLLGSVLNKVMLIMLNS
jgi:hypothetical protein